MGAAEASCAADCAGRGGEWCGGSLPLGAYAITVGAQACVWRLTLAETQARAASCKLHAARTEKRPAKATPGRIMKDSVKARKKKKWATSSSISNYFMLFSYKPFYSLGAPEVVAHSSVVLPTQIKTRPTSFFSFLLLVLSDGHVARERGAAILGVPSLLACPRA